VTVIDFALECIGALCVLRWGASSVVRYAAFLKQRQEASFAAVIAKHQHRVRQCRCERLGLTVCTEPWPCPPPE
jgi:hypothetical protein